jgi:transcription antitermination factor NusG
MEYKTMPAELKLGDCKIQNSASNWYALYTCSGHEKRLAEQIEPHRLSCFLPFYRSVRRRKDRRKELDPVHFRGYVVVQRKRQDRSRAWQLAGVVRVVSFDGRPAALPVGEIEKIRARLSRAPTSNLIPTFAQVGAFT